jgi:alanine dehydrogenase
MPLSDQLKEETMRIGVPKEIKVHEYRVGMTPAAVREAVAHGHIVVVQAGAGAGAEYDDAQYLAVGAEIVATAEEIFARTDMIVKVKEPQPAECAMLREGQILFTYLHLAPNPEQARLLRQSGCTAIAYETVTGDGGGLPLLAPMSEVAGRMSVQVGATCLQKALGGRGVLLGGVPGVRPARVAVLGGGMAGTQAARIAVGMGAEVTVLDTSLPRLRQLDDIFGARLRTLYSTRQALEETIMAADIVVGAVLIPGAATPKLVRREHLAGMRQGTVLVDISIDQGGCFETSRPTSHQDPTYQIDGIVHYCVANMPGAVPHTSTVALNNATLPFTLALADKGWKRACAEDPRLCAGLNVHAGRITCAAVAMALQTDYHSACELLTV